MQKMIKFVVNIIINSMVISSLFLAGMGLAVSAVGVSENVSRAQFTTAIKNREPVDLVVLLENDVSEVFYFTDLRQLSGQTITHRWEYNGKVVAEVPFKVTGRRYRMHTKVALDPKKLGKWTALVIDQAGWVLKASMFEVVPAGLPRDKF